MRSLKRILLIVVNLFSLLLYPQQSKEEYLKQNASQLNESFIYPQKKAKVFGFGAYHGSAKTEEAEIILIKSLIKNNHLKYYFPETDYSLAYYFNEYLATGDEKLLKDLVKNYGTRVPQERTVEVFLKWKELKKINDKLPKNKRLHVLGADPIVTYKYTYRHLLILIKDINKWPSALTLKATVEKDTTDFSPYYESYSKQLLKDFVTNYEADSSKFESLINNKPTFNHLIKTIKTSFGDYNREREIYNNYIEISKIYKLTNNTQFFRYGFFHLLKTKEGTYPTFFSMLIDKGNYTRDRVISTLGYFTKSEVIWEDVFDDNDNFVSSKIEGDIGIGDDPTEYFKGIDLFKNQKLSDMTLFNLSNSNNPYQKMGCSDLIQVIAKNVTEKIDYSQDSTSKFIDFALLITHSKASTSIYSLDK
ncbi:TraB/GumN family protein [Flavobacterium cerinum]|uniref:Erythromycin esterase family protein n=1 Tax=Flavobacterium cerinum TaxID=2502784 RepID=A0A444HBA1_9FLAO|nr:hypothetical protein [Flavobacterium cerinum]RWX00761.1 hypothetical protein EPI11_07000 [Flavobacterium cerinum]